MPEFDDYLTAAGFEPRSTPVDTLMDGPLSMHPATAHFMEHGEEPCDT